MAPQEKKKVFLLDNDEGIIEIYITKRGAVIPYYRTSVPIEPTQSPRYPFYT